ncbi:MAG: molybdopterin dinucleotide binding domain-containing protein, partial [Chloroflexota bacterium]
RNIEQNSLVMIQSKIGTTSLPVKLTNDVAKGVIVVPHGWGHSGSGLTRASKLPGININEVIPGGAENMEPNSGQAIVLGHFVQVERVTEMSSVPA